MCQVPHQNLFEEGETGMVSAVDRVWEERLTDLTGLLVKDTRRDSRQLSSLSSEMPERSSCTYSCDDSVHSCLLFLSPPCGNKTH